MLIAGLRSYANVVSQLAQLPGGSIGERPLQAMRNMVKSIEIGFRCSLLQHLNVGLTACVEDLQNTASEANIPQATIHEIVDIKNVGVLVEGVDVHCVPLQGARAISGSRMSVRNLDWRKVESVCRVSQRASKNIVRPGPPIPPSLQIALLPTFGVRL